MKVRSILNAYLWIVGAALLLDTGLGLRKKNLKRPKGGGALYLDTVRL